MASQPDTGHNAYTFLEFNTQGGDYDYQEFQELSQPSRSPMWRAPAVEALTDPSNVVLQSSDPSGSIPSLFSAGLSSFGKAKAEPGSTAVDSLAVGMSSLNFEETGEDESCKFGKGDFTEHACRYCRVHNPACAVRGNIPLCWKWFYNLLCQNLKFSFADPSISLCRSRRRTSSSSEFFSWFSAYPSPPPSDLSFTQPKRNTVIRWILFLIFDISLSVSFRSFFCRSRRGTQSLGGFFSWFPSSPSLSPSSFGECETK